MIAILLHWSLATPLTLGGTTGKEMRNISGPEVIQVFTPVSAELKGNASMLPSNATATRWRQCNYPIVVSCNFFHYLISLSVLYQFCLMNARCHNDQGDPARHSFKFRPDSAGHFVWCPHLGPFGMFRTSWRIRNDILLSGFVEEGTHLKWIVFRHGKRND